MSTARKTKDRLHSGNRTSAAAQKIGQADSAKHRNAMRAKRSKKYATDPKLDKSAKGRKSGQPNAKKTPKAKSKQHQVKSATNAARNRRKNPTVGEKLFFGLDRYMENDEYPSFK